MVVSATTTTEEMLNYSRNWSTVADSLTSSRNRGSNENVRLPKVCIEPFDGDPLSYPTFINPFEEIIDKNNSLANVEKFYYLRGFGLLKGKAKSTIDGFTLTDSNYKEALNLLKERFGDNKLLTGRDFFHIYPWRTIISYYICDTNLVGQLFAEIFSNDAVVMRHAMPPP